MTSPPTAPPAPSSPPERNQAARILSGAAVLMLLYFGREVLVPVTLAGILSLLVAPLVRVLRRLGAGQVPSVLAAVLALTLPLIGLATVIGSQVVSMAAHQPGLATDAVPVEIRERPLGPMQLLRQVFSSVWGRSAPRMSCWSCSSSSCSSMNRCAIASSS